MKKLNFSSPLINQEFYKPMINFLTDFLKKSKCESTNNHIYYRLMTLGTSYCQPDITEERIEALMSSVGADNLDIIEFINLLREIKIKIEEEKNNGRGEVNAA